MISGKVLIIDDDTDDTEIFCEAIREVDGEIECDVASSGGQALDMIRHSNYQKPALIFLDVNMPIMNGWDVLNKLKIEKGYENVPVIMFSTSASEKDIDHAKSEGALSFFIKPFDYKFLRRGLAVIISHLDEGTLLEMNAEFKYPE